MFSHYLHITLQNLLKHKLYTLINVFGLTIAIASSIVIFLFARNELTFDGFHANGERIHLVYKERKTAQGTQELTDTWAPLLDVIREQVPGVADGVRVWLSSGWLEVGGMKVNEDLTYADSSLFDVFSFPLAQGDAATALRERNSIVLSQEKAAQYFGSEDPIGKIITINFTTDYIVTGVLAPVPRNSSLRPSFIAPFESRFAPAELAEGIASWTSSDLQTFVLLDETATEAAVEAALSGLVASIFGSEGVNGTGNMKLKLWSFLSMHDRTTNSITVSYVLLGIACSIILIACINFMNLSIARALERSREVGVRKTMGSRRGELMALFFMEPLLVSIVALLLSIELARALLPVFNAFFGTELALQTSRDPALFAILLGTGLLVALLCGCYPAFVLSNLKSVDTLKGTAKAGPGGVRVRNGLSFFQFCMAIILVTAIIAAWQQVRYMQRQDPHFDMTNVLAIPVSVSDFADRELAAGQIDTFRNEVARLPGVLSVSASMSLPGAYDEANIFARPEGWESEEPLRMLVAQSDSDYFSTYGMEFTAGRDFDAAIDNRDSVVILNETAARASGWDSTSAVGKKMNDWTVLGVVRDFQYQSLEDPIRPIIHVYMSPEANPAFRFVSVKLAAADAQATLARIEAQWRLFDPGRSFAYYFIEDRFAALYSNVSRQGRILAWFALLSIFIANLGLLGLTSYSVVQRTKEIGIRKVLGGSVPDITLLLSKQFIKPVLLANLLAWPVAFFAISRWLEGFAYRIELNWIIFPLAGLSILVLAMLTLATQSVKAANINPVRALRYE